MTKKKNNKNFGFIMNSRKVNGDIQKWIQENTGIGLLLTRKVLVVSWLSITSCLAFRLCNALYEKEEDYSFLLWWLGGSLWLNLDAELARIYGLYALAKVTKLLSDDQRTLEKSSDILPRKIHWRRKEENCETMRQPAVDPAVGLRMCGNFAWAFLSFLYIFVMRQPWASHFFPDAPKPDFTLILACIYYGTTATIDMFSITKLWIFTPCPTMSRSCFFVNLMYLVLNSMPAGKVTVFLLLLLPAAFYSTCFVDNLLNRLAPFNQMSKNERDLSRYVVAAVLGICPKILTVCCMALSLVWSCYTTVSWALGKELKLDKLSWMLGEEGREAVFKSRYQDAVIKHCRLQDEKEVDGEDGGNGQADAETDVEEERSDQDHLLPECEYKYDVVMSDDEKTDDDENQVLEDANVAKEGEEEFGFVFVR